jgi:beta-glucosidase
VCSHVPAWIPFDRYSSFVYGRPRFEPSTGLAWNGSINITSSLTNTGNVTAQEVAQLYVHDVVASRVRPIRELQGFQKVSLAPGQSVDVSFALTRADLSFAALQPPHGRRGHGGGAIESDSAAQTVEPGMFDVWITHSAVGGSSKDSEGRAPSQFELHAPECDG